MDLGSFVCGVVIFWAIGVVALVSMIAVAHLFKDL